MKEFRLETTLSLISYINYDLHYDFSNKSRVYENIFMVWFFWTPMITIYYIIIVFKFSKSVTVN